MSERHTRRARDISSVSQGNAELRWEGSRATLLLDGVESSCIDTADPSYLEFEYMQHMSCALDATFPCERPLQVLHLGGAACALPWAWSVTHPSSRHVVCEIDEALAALVREWFSIPRSPIVKIRVGDARVSVDRGRAGSYDVVVRDAFMGGVVPPHLRTVESAAGALHLLRPGGLYMLNCAHGGTEDARVDAAALLEVFPQVWALCDPKVGRSGRRGNIVLVAQAPLDEGEAGGESSEEGVLDLRELDRLLRKLPLPARPLSDAQVRAWHAGTRPLRDADAGWQVADVS